MPQVRTKSAGDARQASSMIPRMTSYTPTRDGFGPRLNFEEAKVYLGATEPQLRRWVRERRINYIKTGPGKGSPLKFDRADLDKFLVAGRVEAI